MDSDIHAKLEELKQLQLQAIMLLQHLHGKKANNEEWLDNNDLCRVLKVTYRTVLRWRKKGLIKAVLIGGKFYYHKEAMESLRAKR